MKTTEISLETLASVLIRSFWIGLAFLNVWFFLFLVTRDLAYPVHKGIWTDLSRHQFDLAIYGALGLFKLGILGFFLVPYLGIRWYLRSASG